MQILVVEDDAELSDILVHVLKREGYETDAVFDGRMGLEYAKSGTYDAIILDVMLPNLDGFQVVRALRAAGVETPVLMLTALGSVPDRVEGLDGGADQYVSKPFSPRELLARLRALTRRTAAPVADTLVAGDVTLDGGAYALSCGDEMVKLSDQEYLLARLLFENPQRLLTRAQIAEGAWKGLQVEDHTIDAYISLLRKKLGFLSAKAGIETQRGIGYRLVALEEE